MIKNTNISPLEQYEHGRDLKIITPNRKSFKTYENIWHEIYPCKLDSFDWLKTKTKALGNMADMQMAKLELESKQNCLSEYRKNRKNGAKFSARIFDRFNETVMFIL